MDKSFFKIAFILMILISSLVFFVGNSSFISSDQDSSVQTQFERSFGEKSLYVLVPSSLNDYYQNLDHLNWDNRSYSKFVTPELFSDVAKEIRSSISDPKDEDEVFVNLVLDFVHNIEYKKSGLKFPIETLSDSYGDCDSLSFLAASIMKAGGLDVVLFFYDINSSVNHMNLGVSLPDKKLDGTNGTEPFFYSLDGKNYFVCEATGSGWKAGNQPKNYVDSKPKIIPVDDMDTQLFEPISSSLNFALKPSFVSLELRPLLVDGKIGEKFEVFGSVSPGLEKQKVNVLIKHESELETVVKSVFTDESGKYQVFFDFNLQGKYSIQSVWNGFGDFFASESEKVLLNVGASSFLNDHEIFETVRVGEEIFEMPMLTDSGKRIFRGQPIKTVFDQEYSCDFFDLETQITFFGNDEPYLTSHNITIPAHEKMIIEDGQLITKLVPEETVEISNYREKLHSKLLLNFVVNQELLNFSVQLIDNSKIQEWVENSNERIIDVSSLFNENAPYVVKSHLDDDQIFFQIFDQNVMIFDEARYIDSINWEFNVILDYDPDSIPCLIINKDDNFEVSKYLF